MITRIRVGGMTCQHCVRAVFTSLAGVPGISRADVSIGMVEIEHAAPIDLDEVKRAVELAGYQPGAVETNRRRLPLSP